MRKLIAFGGLAVAGTALGAYGAHVNDAILSAFGALVVAIAGLAFLFSVGLVIARALSRVGRRD
jgi:hypothetical protein